ncbi:hypothetical protein QOT17_015751 [Balamuthia mandrillaris]
MGLFDCRSSWFRHAFFSGFAGCLFAAAWLIWIDGALVGNKFEGFIAPKWWFYLPGVVATFVLLMMNMVSLGDLRNQAFFSEEVSKRVRAWLFVTFAIGFGCIAASIWMSVDLYSNQGGKVWPGVALVMQSILILTSSVILLFTRREEEEEDWGYAL